MVGVFYEHFTWPPCLVGKNDFWCVVDSPAADHGETCSPTGAWEQERINLQSVVNPQTLAVNALNLSPWACLAWLSRLKSGNI